MVFYFTATGNSLYVAKQLERDPVSIPQIIKKIAVVLRDVKNRKLVRKRQSA